MNTTTGPRGSIFTCRQGVKIQVPLTKYEGTLRRHFRREDGTIRDSVLFSVTVDDWPDVRHRLGQRVRTFLGTAERDLR